MRSLVCADRWIPDEARVLPRTSDRQEQDAGLSDATKLAVGPYCGEELDPDVSGPKLAVAGAGSSAVAALPLGDHRAAVGALPEGLALGAR